MESKKTKILLYKKRDFGQRLSVTFDFIKTMWKPLLKYTTYFLLPISLIQAIFMNGMGSKAFDLKYLETAGNSKFFSWGVNYIENYGAYCVIYIIGYALLVALVYGLMKAYSTTDDPHTITFADIRSTFQRDFNRTIILIIATGIFICVCIVFIVLLAIVTPITLLITIPGIVAIIIPITLVTPIYILDENKTSIPQAFTKAFRIGFPTWGSTFVLIIVVGLIAGILRSTLSMPWYVLYIIKTYLIASSSQSSIITSYTYSFILYLTGILMCFALYLSSIIMLVGTAYQYGHISEKIDNTSINNDIENFDNLQ